MKTQTKFLTSFCLLLASSWLAAAEVTKAQIKGLDEQVQDIKKDVLSISAELNQLEEKLLYPSNTQVSFFVSVAPGSQYQPDAIQLSVDGKVVAHYIYSFKEVEALQKGGAQRVYTGNVRSGDHKLKVSAKGRTGGSIKTNTREHVVSKGIGPQFVEIQLSGSEINVKNW